MPNHIVTIISVDKDLSKVTDFMKSEDSKFDFNNLIPCPKVIKDVGNIHSGIETAVKAKYQTPFSGNIALASLEIQNRMKAKTSFEKEEDNNSFKLACKAYEETGYIYWYDWTVKNWGTKWNAYDIEISDSSIKFETAWSHPILIIEALTKKFPEIAFNVKYADEDLGYNCGIYSVKNDEVVETEIISGSKEAYYLAAELHGYKEGKDYKIIDGEFEWIEE